MADPFGGLEKLGQIAHAGGEVGAAAEISKALWGGPMKAFSEAWNPTQKGGEKNEDVLDKLFPSLKIFGA